MSSMIERLIARSDESGRFSSPDCANNTTKKVSHSTTPSTGDRVTNTQNNRRLKSAIVPTRDRTRPTPREGSHSARVRFSEDEPKVRYYNRDIEKTMKPLPTSSKPDRKNYSPKEMARRLKEPVTLFMTEKQKLLVSPIQSRRDLAAAQERAKD